MANIVVKRGEIFYADLTPVIGSEQGGIRPVVIIQNDIGNRYSPTVIAAAITSQINKAKLPIHVEIAGETYGLNRDSVVLLEQIRTLDKRRLKEKIGLINKEDMKRIDKAWAISSGIETYDELSAKKEKEIQQYYNYKLNRAVEFLEENLGNEFKEIIGEHPVRAIKGNVGQYITSFLNKQGGIIYYGISDTRIVKGIKLNKNEKDEVRRGIYDAITGIEPNISPDSINIDFKNVYGYDNGKLENTYVLEVQVNRRVDEQEIYLYKNEIYLKTNGGKKRLQGHELVDYIRQKTIKDYIK